MRHTTGLCRAGELLPSYLLVHSTYLGSSGAFCRILTVAIHCNRLARIQKALVDDTGHRTAKSHDNLFRMKYRLRKVLCRMITVLPLRLALSINVEDWFLITCHNLNKKYVNIFTQEKSRRHLKMTIFYFWKFCEEPVYWPISTFSYLLSRQNCHGRYDSFCCKCSNRFAGIYVAWSSHFVIGNIGRPATTLVIFKALVTTAEFLKPPLCRKFKVVAGPNESLIFRAICATFWPSQSWKKKVVWVCRFSMLFEVLRKVEGLFINKISVMSSKSKERALNSHVRLAD